MASSSSSSSTNKCRDIISTRYFLPTFDTDITVDDALHIQYFEKNGEDVKNIEVKMVAANAYKLLEEAISECVDDQFKAPLFHQKISDFIINACLRKMTPKKMQKNVVEKEGTNVLGLIINFFPNDNMTVYFLKIFDFIVKDKSHGVYAVIRYPAFSNTTNIRSAKLSRKAIKDTFRFIIAKDPPYFFVRNDNTYVNLKDVTTLANMKWSLTVCSKIKTDSSICHNKVTTGYAFVGSGGKKILGLYEKNLMEKMQMKEFSGDTKKGYDFYFYHQGKKSIDIKNLTMEFINNITSNARESSLMQHIIVFVCNTYYPQCSNAFQRVLQIQLCHQVKKMFDKGESVYNAITGYNPKTDKYEGPSECLGKPGDPNLHLSAIFFNNVSWDVMKFFWRSGSDQMAKIINNASEYLDAGKRLDRLRELVHTVRPTTVHGSFISPEQDSAIKYEFKQAKNKRKPEYWNFGKDLSCKLKKIKI